MGMGQKDSYMGNEAQQRQHLTLKYLKEPSITANGDKTERIWRHSPHNKVHVSPKKCGVLLIEPSRIPRPPMKR